MNTAELITGIVLTRSDMATTTRQDCDAIYRRLLPIHQAAWDELCIPNLWLRENVQKLQERVALAEAKAAKEGA